MATHAMHEDQRPTLALPRWLIVGFISGAFSVLLFHQGAAALLQTLELTPRAPYSMDGTAPFGIPQLWSLAFWGGVWGALLAATLARLRGGAVIVGAAIFGAVLPTLVAWFVVAALKGQPIAAGFAPMAMLVGPIVNAAWGLGTGIGLALFGHKHPKLKDEPLGMRRARRNHRERRRVPECGRIRQRPHRITALDSAER